MFVDVPVDESWADLASQSAEEADQVADSVESACAAAAEAGVAIAESQAALRAVHVWRDRIKDAWSESAWSTMCHQQDALASATEADLATPDTSPTKRAAMDALGAAELADLHGRSTIAETRLSWNDDVIDPLVALDNAAAEALDEALEWASPAAAIANAAGGANSNSATAALERVLAALETVNDRWQVSRAVSNALYEAQAACTDPTGKVELQISIARAAVWHQRAESFKRRA